MVKIKWEKALGIIIPIAAVAGLAFLLWPKPKPGDITGFTVERC